LLPKLTGRNTFLHSAARFAVPLVTRCDGLPKKLLTIAQIFVRVKPTLRAGSTARAIVSTGHRNADAFFGRTCQTSIKPKSQEIFMKHVKNVIARSLLTSTLLLAASHASATVVIDEFSSGRNWFGIDSASPSFVQGPPQTGAGIICGTRETWLGIGYGPSGQGLFVESMVGAGALSTHSDYGQTYGHSLVYGTPTLLNANMGAETELSLRFRHITHPLKLTVYAVTEAGGGFTAGGSAINIDITASATAKTVKIPFANFYTNHGSNLPVNWSNVDRFLFVFNNATINSQSFSLESIKATGSPANVAAGC
jgi:hypothetical protein